MDATATSGEGAAATGGSSDRVKMTIDDRLRALIVLGNAEDLNFIEKLINQIDIPTKQILVEAYVVTVKDTFTSVLGKRLSALYSGNTPAGNYAPGRYPISIAGTAGSDSEAMRTDMTTGFTDVGSFAKGFTNGGLGVILDAGLFNMQLEVEALETNGVVKTVSNPKLFTLDNQQASIKQGVELPYTSVDENGKTVVAFKDAALNFIVTPSIVGDGNITLDINLNADEQGTSTVNGNFSVDTVEIKTKLLVQDNSVVIIGGVYKNSKNDSEMKIPFVGDIPVFGSLFKRRTDTDQFNRIYMFIAPKIL